MLPPIFRLPARKGQVLQEKTAMPWEDGIAA
jgi:hypothetical protein